jgi:hypothetical protein
MGGKGDAKKGGKPGKGKDNGKKGGNLDKGKGQPGNGKGKDKGGIGTGGRDMAPYEPHPTKEEYEEFMAYTEEEQMPKRLKTLTRGFRYQETKRMCAEDHWSDIGGMMAKKEQIGVEVVERIVERIVYIEKSPSTSKPKFAAGQSVHQWWADWMPGASERPVGIKGNTRPQWFSSVVFVLEQLCPQACRNAGVPGTSPGTNLRRAAPSIPACRPAC